MNTTDDLRAALADDSTPAGIDVGAVRRRAGRQRRWAAAGAAAAVVAVALAVALPLQTTRGSAPPLRPSITPPSPAAADCPSYYPEDLGNSGGGLGERLVPMAVDSVLACQYILADTLNPLPDFEVRYLTGSRQLPAQAGRTLLAAMEQAAPRHPAGCAKEGESVLLRVTGAGRTVWLRVGVYGCGVVTNGETSRFAGQTVTTDLPRLLSATPPRVSCPEQEPRQHPGQPGPADRLVPFRPDYVLFCDWSGPGMHGEDQLGPPQEADGEGARRYVQALESLPTAEPKCAPDPGLEGTYLVVILGQGQRATLFGSRKCFHLTNGRRTVYQSSTGGVPQLGK